MKRALVLLCIAACERKTVVTLKIVDASTPPSVVSVPPDAGDPNAAIVAEMNAMTPAASWIPLPAVACKGDGQMGPHAIPIPTKHEAPLTKALAEIRAPETKLTLYYGDSGVVLGPTGWHCESAMGSGGAVTWVLPAGSKSHDHIISAAIVHHQNVGGTSGRFTVVAVGAPVFPILAPMVADVVKGWPDTKPPPPYAPVPGEKVWMGKTLVRFADDPNVSGFLDLEPSSAPIAGSLRVIGEGEVFDLQTISIRVDGPLVGAIQADFEDRTLRP